MSGNLVPFPNARPAYVLDTWPVMEWLKDRQPYADRFKELLARAQRGDILLMMSMMNVGEVYYNSIKEWGLEEAEKVLLRLDELPIALLPVGNEDVLAAGRLKAPGGISYADCFAASLTIGKGCPLVTGDPDFQVLAAAGTLQLHWLGR